MRNKILDCSLKGRLHNLIFRLMAWTRLKEKLPIVVEWRIATSLLNIVGYINLKYCVLGIHFPDSQLSFAKFTGKTQIKVCVTPAFLWILQASE